MAGNLIQAPGEGHFFQNERGNMVAPTKATRVSLLPDKKSASLKIIDTKNKTSESKDLEPEPSIFDKDSDEYGPRETCWCH